MTATLEPSPVEQPAQFVAGPCWYDADSDVWTTEIQFVGGDFVLAEVYGSTQDLAEQRRDQMLAALQPVVSEGDHADEYMSVSISRDGVVTSHNAFDASFDEMVAATQKIIVALQQRYANRLKCPFAAGDQLRKAAEEADQPSVAGALTDIGKERRRQIDGEGWTPEHDDEHGDGQLAAAAAAYAYTSSLPDRLRQYVTGIYSINNISMARDLWPWDKAWWKPKERRQDLVRAGALIVAEIERIDRAAAKAAAEDREDA